MITVPLTQNQVAFIDDEDLDKISGYKWRATRYHSMRTFYAIADVPETKDHPRTTIKMHRLIMDLSPEVKDDVDHKDHNGLNNQKDNLRLCNANQNQANKSKYFTYNGEPTSSRYKGVSLNKRSKKWIARITNKGQKFHLGTFLSEEEAALNYNLAAIQHFGKWASLNVIEETV